jgi:hypothetical protein
MLEKPEEWTIQRHWQHCTHKTGQYRDNGNIVQNKLIINLGKIVSQNAVPGLKI